MEQKRVLISVIDDDISLRESLPDLLKTLGFAARSFASAEEFLASDGLYESHCLLLDISMPGISGPQLQGELRHHMQNIPIIFMTALSDHHITSVLVARGAVDCLFKPFSAQELCSALDRALGK